MTNTKSAAKQARASERRQDRNKAVKSRCRTSVARAEGLIFAGELEEAGLAVASAVSSLDKAAEKGIIHPNNAARRKSRLLKKLNQAQVPPVTESGQEKT